MTSPRFIPHYTVADYLLWEGDWELWDGIPVAMSPSPNFGHQKLSSEIVARLRNQLIEEPCEAGCTAICDLDWHVNDSTVVRPDVMVLCEEPTGDFVESAPSLVVEILSPSTREKDLTSKRDLYAAEGVTYYLIFDPTEEKAQFLELDEGAYREIAPDSVLRLDDDCEVSLEVKGILAA